MFLSAPYPKAKWSIQYFLIFTTLTGHILHEKELYIEELDYAWFHFETNFTEFHRDFARWKKITFNLQQHELQVSATSRYDSGLQVIEILLLSTSFSYFHFFLPHFLEQWKIHIIYHWSIYKTISFIFEGQFCCYCWYTISFVVILSRDNIVNVFKVTLWTDLFL